MISLKFSSMPELGAGVGPSPVTRLLRELKERGRSKGRGSLGSMKKGTPEIENPQSLILQMYLEMS